MKYEKYHAPVSLVKVYNIPGGVCHLYPDCPTGRLSAALVDQDGRYPESGFRQNEFCTEAIFVVEGDFKMICGGEEIILRKHDIFYIPLKTPYAIEGRGQAFVFIEPQWDSEQNKAVEG